MGGWPGSRHLLWTCLVFLSLQACLCSGDRETMTEAACYKEDACNMLRPACEDEELILLTASEYGYKENDTCTRVTAAVPRRGCQLQNYGCREDYTIDNAFNLYTECSGQPECEVRAPVGTYYCSSKWITSQAAFLSYQCLSERNTVNLCGTRTMSSEELHLIFYGTSYVKRRCECLVSAPANVNWLIVTAVDVRLGFSKNRGDCSSAVVSVNNYSRKCNGALENDFIYNHPVVSTSQKEVKITLDELDDTTGLPAMVWFRVTGPTGNEITVNCNNAGQGTTSPPSSTDTTATGTTSTTAHTTSSPTTTNTVISTSDATPSKTLSPTSRQTTSSAAGHTDGVTSTVSPDTSTNPALPAASDRRTGGTGTPVATIVVPVVLAIALVVAIVAILLWRRRRSRKPEKSDDVKINLHAPARTNNDGLPLPVENRNYITFTGDDTTEYSTINDQSRDDDDDGHYATTDDPDVCDTNEDEYNKICFKNNPVVFDPNYDKLPQNGTASSTVEEGCDTYSHLGHSAQRSPLSVSAGTAAFGDYSHIHNTQKRGADNYSHVQRPANSQPTPASEPEGHDYFVLEKTDDKFTVSAKSAAGDRLQASQELAQEEEVDGHDYFVLEKPEDGVGFSPGVASSLGGKGKEQEQHVPADDGDHDYFVLEKQDKTASIDRPGMTNVNQTGKNGDKGMMGSTKMPTDRVSNVYSGLATNDEDAVDEHNYGVIGKKSY